MPSNIAAVPLANAKRKHRRDEDEEDDEDDAGSDVVRGLDAKGAMCSADCKRSAEHGQRRFRLLQSEPRGRRVRLHPNRIKLRADNPSSPPSIALKRLLNQLFTSDAQLFDVHALATLILACAKEYGVGSCVKVDGEESDPYAYLSVVDLASRAVCTCALSLSSWLTADASSRTFRPTRHSRPSSPT